MNNILEISEKIPKGNRGGRVAIKIILCKIHDDPKETNFNGLHWKEEYVSDKLDTIVNMPMCASFVDDDKTIPLDHGYTGEEINDDGIIEPLFENSETVGSFSKGYIDDVVVDGQKIRALIGEGVLYYQRYPNFVKWLRQSYTEGNVDTSVEILGTEENDHKIIYEERTPTRKFRTPKEFVFSGSSFLSVTPGDKKAIVLEIAQKNKTKEEQNDMDKNELMTAVREVFNEFNSKESEINAELDKANSTIIDKDKELAAKEEEICSLNDKVAKLEKALEDIEREQKTKWAEYEAVMKELGELKTKQRLGELDDALGDYSDDERKYAESEINEFRENPMDGNIDTILSKICVGIVAKQKEDARVSEQNAHVENTDVSDIFSDVNMDESENIEIF